MVEESQIDALFARLADGDESAREALFELVHGELHRLARAEMARQSPSHTLQPTALVNEAFLKLQGGKPGSWSDHAHFIRLAGRAMRQVLVDHARSKSRLKRTEPGQRKELDEVAEAYDQRTGVGLLALEGALESLQVRDPEMVQLIELRFFAGRSMEEVADILGISLRSAARRWQTARVFLKSELGE